MASGRWLILRMVDAGWSCAIGTFTRALRRCGTHWRLRAKCAILNGEIVALDSNGVSQFKELLYRRGRAVFFAFDLLWLDGVDLGQTPLIERKKKLKKLVERSECSEILFAQHIEGNGKLLFEEVVERNLEGMVARG